MSAEPGEVYEEDRRQAPVIVPEQAGHSLYILGEWHSLQDASWRDIDPLESDHRKSQGMGDPRQGDFG